MDTSIIGTEMGGTTMEVERGKIMEFAKAILDEDPAYQNADPPLPPTYSMAIAHWPAPSGEGMGKQFQKLGLDLLRVLHAGQEFEYLGEIHAGDTLSTRSKIVDMYEKEGKRGGTMLFIKSETTFTNQSGKDVLKSTSTLVQTSKAAS